MNREVARALRAPFGRAARDEHGTLVGAVPGEWLLLAPPGTVAEVAERVEEIPDDRLVSVFNSTHGRAPVRITRARAAELLAKVVTDVVRNGRGVLSYLPHCERSSGQYLFGALMDACGEFGMEAESFEIKRGS